MYSGLTGAFSTPTDTGGGVKRPVVFDVLAPDMETSILPEGLRLVLHTNPKSMTWNYTKVISRITTKGGFVEQHWGDAARSVTLQSVTGGFVRIYAGITTIAGGEQNRRQTLAYDKYLDVLALFKNNGSIYNDEGSIVLQGAIKMSYDDQVYIGWFQSFSVSEDVQRPYMFEITAEFTIAKEYMRVRS